MYVHRSPTPASGPSLAQCVVIRLRTPNGSSKDRGFILVAIRHHSPSPPHLFKPLSMCIVLGSPSPRSLPRYPLLPGFLLFIRLFGHRWFLLVSITLPSNVHLFGTDFSFLRRSSLNTRHLLPQSPYPFYSLSLSLLFNACCSYSHLHNHTS